MPKGLQGFQKGNKGFRNPESYKRTGRKIIKTLKGKLHPWLKGKPSGMLGKHHSKKTKGKISMALMGNQNVKARWD